MKQYGDFKQTKYLHTMQVIPSAHTNTNTTCKHTQASLQWLATSWILLCQTRRRLRSGSTNIVWLSGNGPHPPFYLHDYTTTWSMSKMGSRTGGGGVQESEATRKQSVTSGQGWLDLVNSQLCVRSQGTSWKPIIGNKSTWTRLSKTTFLGLKILHTIHNRGTNTDCQMCCSILLQGYFFQTLPKII